ncbi:amidohydrolase [Bradyrhizobium sp. WSM1743]|uniref:amidohydrolase n=1 Tax=Bradyrhizobium sp. WSM1743 TaxID=318996 RepID=UPI00041CF533|nr:amidohydrolase [Bradyrhizobium sp. WSM1743]
MRNSDAIWDIADQKAPAFHKLSDDVWEKPELNYQEFAASAAHANMLRAQGFRVETNVAGLPTAVMGEAGEGGPVIAILGEFDALPDLSQEAGVAVHKPITSGGSGHGCGHNMLGAAALLAAAAVKDWLAANGQKGRVRYYGCPAEENGSGKGFMVRAGVFSDVDVAICWHPADFTGVFKPQSLACVEIEFTFHGRASHAAVAPHLGRSALDAVELMNVGVNYMREHMPSSARVHYAITDTGGLAPNVVQARASVRHLVRALDLNEMWNLVERVKNIAQGAALMTETRVEVKQLSGEANLVANRALESAMEANLLRLGGPGFDAADRAFAAQIQKTISAEDIKAAYARYGLQPQEGELLSERIYPTGHVGELLPGSTDVGTVSWVVPTVQCRVACYAVGTRYHSWQLVAQGKLPAAHKGLTHAAKAMAGVAVDVLSNKNLLKSVKEEFDAFRAKNEFKNPIAEDIVPPLDMAAP